MRAIHRHGRRGGGTEATAAAASGTATTMGGACVRAAKTRMTMHLTMAVTSARTAADRTLVITTVSVARTTLGTSTTTRTAGPTSRGTPAVPGLEAATAKTRPRVMCRRCPLQLGRRPVRQ